MSGQHPESGHGDAVDPHGLLSDALWLSLLPPGDSNDSAVLAWRLRDVGADGPTAFVRALAQVPNGASVLVLADRRCLRTLLRIKDPRRWLRTPSKRQLLGTLAAAGVRSTAVHLVWPDIGQARVTGPIRSGRLWHWAQRSGVLGGGGSRMLVRWLLRSPLFTPLVGPFTAGVAVVGWKRAP